MQASSLLDKDRKAAVDRVQQIVADQQPFIYLVYPNALYAISPNLAGMQPAVMQPGVVWNITTIRQKGTQ
jgi:peptide/nickel transport system substrate-binding protein